MDSSNCSKLDILAEVCFREECRAVEQVDLVKHLRPTLNFLKKKMSMMMPRELRDLIREKPGLHVKLIIKKELCDSDVNQTQNRLSMPLKRILFRDFLNHNENMILTGNEEHGRIPNDSVIVGFVEPCLTETTLTLKKRKFNRGSSYVLINNWRGVVERSGLKKGDTVRARSFRVKDRPWIALAKCS